MEDELFVPDGEDREGLAVEDESVGLSEASDAPDFVDNTD